MLKKNFLFNYKYLTTKILKMQNISYWEAKLIGRKFVKGEETTDDGQKVNSSELPEKHRVLPPGTMTTMDFVEDRLNVHLDDNNVITKVRFG